LNKQARVEIVDDNDLSILGTIIPDSSDNINQESNDKGFHLFIYPAESNYSGKKFPLDWSEKYQRINQNSNSNGFQWKTLLDASSFISCNQLDLSKYPFDFVTFSFHKLFGYPSGLGGLLIRKGLSKDFL
jgi:molybdenum cofactor sulfurtransferase